MLEIIRNNYIIFTVIAVILIFSLIGYIADHSIRKNVTVSDIKKEKEKIEEEKIEEVNKTESL